MSSTTVICTLPVKNEAWILKRFLDNASSWADLIVVLDDDSSDGSARIAREYDRVKLIVRRNPPFDEDIRRRILIEEARRVTGKRLIFNLDADEMLSTNWRLSPEWNLMSNSPPGTSFRFEWLEILPGVKKCAAFTKEVAFVDDGSEYRGVKKDSCKVPAMNGEAISLREIKLLHFIHLDPDRMFSRHRWYKCYELIENGKRPWDICVRYQDTEIKTYNAPIVEIDEEWIRGLDWLAEFKGSCRRGGVYWWDEEILKHFDRLGTQAFKKLNIWDVDWTKKAQMLGRTGSYRDPRSGLESAIHRYIAKHREKLKAGKGLAPWMRSLLGCLGW